MNRIIVIIIFRPYVLIREVLSHCAHCVVDGGVLAMQLIIAKLHIDATIFILVCLII